MKRTLFVQREYSDQNFNLRSFLNGNEYRLIENVELTDNSIFVVDYTQLVYTDTEIVLAPILKKINTVNDGNLLIRHDFSVDVSFLAEYVKKLIQIYKINNKNIYIQLCFESDKRMLSEQLKNMNLGEINILIYNHYLNRVYVTVKDRQQKEINTNFKFSAFSRKFKDWRFHFFCELVEHDLLKDFKFTFSNLDPELVDWPHVIIQKENLWPIVEKIKVKKLDSIREFINNLPYVIEDEILTFPFIDKIYDFYQESHINVILETDCANTPNGIKITEKTYKAIAMGKPFIFFGAPKSLDVLKDDGFKTFDPHINENYDWLFLITDAEGGREKINFLIKEIKRIVDMTEDEFNNLMTHLNEIADYNRKHFYYLAEKNHNHTLLEDLRLK